MKRYLKIFMVLIIFIILARPGLTVKAESVLNVTATAVGKTYTQSGICYSVDKIGNFTVYANQTGGGNVKGIYIKWQKPGDKPEYASSEHWDFKSDYGVTSLTAQYYTEWIYVIRVVGDNGTWSQMTIDFHHYTPATTGITYTTEEMVVTAIDGEPSSGHRIILNGDTEISQVYWDEIAKWNDMVRDGKPHSITGYGLVAVYNNGVKKNVYSTLTQLKALQNCYSWDYQTRNIAFPSRQKMTLSYTAPYDGEMVRDIYYDGVPWKHDVYPPVYVYPNTGYPTAIMDGGQQFAGYHLDLANSWSQLGPNSVYKYNNPQTPITKVTGINYTLKPGQTHLYSWYSYVKDVLPLKGQFGLDAKPDATQVVKTAKINNTNSIIVNLLQNSTDLKAWKDYIAKNPTEPISISINISRDKAGMNLGPVSGIPWNGNYKSVTKDELFNYLEEGKTTIYSDMVTDYPIGIEETVQFTYSAVVSIKVGALSAPLTPNPGSDSVSFFRPNPNFASYTSVPSYNSELKTGAPMSEPFEAMAGTPTTRSLYLASGGSEFIVDVTAEYRNDGTATRNYRSEFNAVTCGWYLPTITGGSQRDSLPSAPTPRTITDSNGASYTETISPNTTWSWDVNPIPEVTGPGPVDALGNPTTIVVSPFVAGIGWHSTNWWVQNGHSGDMVGGWSDTWSQKLTFDYMRINKVKVWKLSKSRITGLTELTGTDSVKATITQGDPSIFYNIDTSNTSTGGRLRYSLETNQHDNVVWNHGNSDNAHDGTNSKDSGVVKEQDYFKADRDKTTDVTVISDMLILQTDQGDQSVLYFDKKSATVKTTEDIAVPKTSYETMWTGNGLSASSWSESQIKVGSYNGNYSTPMNAFSQHSGNQVSTAYDYMPAGKARPSRPGANMLLNKNDIQPILTIKNGEYITGNSYVFYENILNYGGGASPYSIANNSNYGLNGAEFQSTYSSQHTKINNIVIHNPVASQYGIVLPTNPKLDQRTPATKGLGGNLQPPEIEIERKLDPSYRSNQIFNGDCEALTNLNMPSGWTAWSSSAGSGNVLTRRTGVSSVITGTNSFEINTVSNSGSGVDNLASYSQTINVSSSTNYKFTGKMSTERCVGYFNIWDIDSQGAETLNSQSTFIQNNTLTQSISIDFKTKPSSKKIRLEIAKGQTFGYIVGQRDYLLADDLIITNQDTAGFIAITTPVYDIVTVENPNYVEPVGSHEHDASCLFTLIPEKYDCNNLPLNTGGSGGSYTGTPGCHGADGNGNCTYCGNPYSTCPHTPYQWNAGSPHTSHVHNGSCAKTLESKNYTCGNLPINTWTINSTVQNPFAISNLTGLGYNTNTAPVTLKLPTVVVGDVAVIITTNGQSENNTTYIPSVPVDFIRTGLTTNGRTIYTKKLIASDVGREITMSGGYTWGYVYFTVPSNFNLSSVISSMSTSLTYNSSGKDISIVADINGTPMPNGYNLFGVIGSAQEIYTRSFLSTDSLVLPSTNGFHNGNYPFLIFTKESAVKTHVKPATEPKTIQKSVLSAVQPLTKPPLSAYIDVTKTLEPNKPIPVPGVGTVSAGTFIHLDAPFFIYFPNKGDFFGDGSWGISQDTMQRGKGFVDGMDTTEWTKSKSVTFDYNVLFNGVAYKAGTEIQLPVAQDTFEFYCVLGNVEKNSATVTYKAIANNCEVFDNNRTTNKIRNSRLSAQHSATTNANTDLLGRIGNLVIEDTGDFRFANFFKTPLTTNDWIVPNVVKDVDVTKQNNIIGSKYDLKGNLVSEGTNYLNTYGLLPHLNRMPVGFPLSPEKNNIDSLKKQPLRLGYNIYADVQTIGNYYNKMTIDMHYYYLDLSNGDIKPIDLYMSNNNTYSPIYRADGVRPTSPFKLSMDWVDESVRRNYTDFESTTTNQMKDAYNMIIPNKSDLPIGDAQNIILTDPCRTFIGNTYTYESDKDPNYVIPITEYNVEAQRWHFTVGLPSSTIAVLQGEKPNNKSIDKLRNNMGVIVAATDITAIGNPYCLNYKFQEGNNPIVINGNTYPTTSIPYNVFAVYSINKSSADDLDVMGTH